MTFLGNNTIINLSKNARGCSVCWKVNFITNLSMMTIDTSCENEAVRNYEILSEIDKHSDFLATDRRGKLLIPKTDRELCEWKLSSLVDWIIGTYTAGSYVKPLDIRAPWSTILEYHWMDTAISTIHMKILIRSVPFPRFLLLRLQPESYNCGYMKKTAHSPDEREDERG